MKKKSILASKQKALTKSLEMILVGFIDENCAILEVGISYDLPGHVRGVIRIHVSDILQIIRQEICNNVTEG